MTLSRLLLFIIVGLFCSIGLAAFIKGKAPKQKSATYVPPSVAQEIIPEIPKSSPVIAASEEPVAIINSGVQNPIENSAPPSKDVVLPDANRIEELFNKEGQGPQLPIVETITYKSRVAWQSGRPAWLTDYANHYETSRHFIARSLNGRPDYLKQEIKEGDRFNVLRKGNYRFHLVVDTSRCKLWFYYVDPDEKKNVLIKTYQVGLGRPDTSKGSEMLTPIGTYSLGNKTATYKPKNMGTYQGNKTEMITVFGTRWIPFEREIGSCTAPARGFGIHGTPWAYEKGKAEPKELLDSLGKYESDGCIRMATADIEEIYAIIVTKPAQIELVRDFNDSTMAGE